MPTTQMAAQKTARRKLASELSNLSKACKIMEYSRQQFYEIRRIFQTYGAEGLLDQFPRARNPHPNRVSEEAEKAILDYCMEHPTHGCIQVDLSPINVTNTNLEF